MNQKIKSKVSELEVGDRMLSKYGGAPRTVFSVENTSQDRNLWSVRLGLEKFVALPGNREYDVLRDQTL